MRLQEFLLLEDKIEYVANTFGEKLLKAVLRERKREKGKKPWTALEIVQKLQEADVKGKHIVWIARMYAAEQFLFEDMPQIKDQLESYEKLRNKLEKKDLNAYKSLEELYIAMSPFESGGEGADIDSMYAIRDVTWLFKTKNFKACKPESESAACELGKDTKWCTSWAPPRQNQFQHYKNKGDLVIIFATLAGKPRKFQLHYETGSFMNENDARVNQTDIAELSKHPQWAELLNLLIKKHY